MFVNLRDRKDVHQLNTANDSFVTNRDNSVQISCYTISAYSTNSYNMFSTCPLTKLLSKRRTPYMIGIVIS